MSCYCFTLVLFGFPSHFQVLWFDIVTINMRHDEAFNHSASADLPEMDDRLKSVLNKGSVIKINAFVFMSHTSYKLKTGISLHYS
jgi:hypothetical protein